MAAAIALPVPTVVALLVPAAAADSTRLVAHVVVVGRAGVTDGDTIRMSSALVTSEGTTKELTGVRIRLFGIDAPEKNQTCLKMMKEWSCGQDASRAMAAIIRGKEVTCYVRDTDRFKRLVAVCSVSGIPDINAEMVKQGYAVAYRKYSMDYVDEEETARKAGAGLWASEFDMPWNYRHTS